MLKSVLVTGASSGIGESTAVLLAQKGFHVFAGARRKDRLAPLEGLGRGRITPVELDVNDEGSINAAIAEIYRSKTLYALVNNAGVSVTGPIELVSANEWRRQFETNVFGLVGMIRAVLPHMRSAGNGRIVNIGSVAGRLASPFMGAYAASKHAVEGLTDALRREVEPFGVRVSLIRPGFINTPFGEQEQEGLRHFEVEGSPYAERVARFRAWHAKGHPRGAMPSAVAEAVHHALTTARPHSRYTVPAKYIGALMARNLAPSALTDRVFAKVIGLRRRGP